MIFVSDKYTKIKGLTPLTKIKGLTPLSKIKGLTPLSFSSIHAERISAADEQSNNLPGSTPLEVQRSGNSIYLRANAVQDWEVLRITLAQ